MLRTAIATVVVCLLAAGCSSTGTPAAAPAPARPSGPPADGGTYPDPNAVLTALAAGGAPCVEPSPVANPTAKGALSMVDCGSTAGHSDVVVVVFDSPADAQGWAEVMTAPGPLAAEAVVYGRDWAVNATADYAARVQRVLGGGELTGPSPTAS